MWASSLCLCLNYMYMNENHFNSLCDSVKRVKLKMEQGRWGEVYNSIYQYQLNNNSLVKAVTQKEAGSLGKVSGSPTSCNPEITVFKEPSGLSRDKQYIMWQVELTLRSKLFYPKPFFGSTSNNSHCMVTWLSWALHAVPKVVDYNNNKTYNNLS